MKIKQFIAVALATTILSTAAYGLVGCDKDAADLGGIVSGITGGENKGAEYTVSFNANGGTTTATPKTTTNGKLSGTMPTASKDNHDFVGWATTSTATTPDITAANYTTYVFTGTTKTVTLYAVYKLKDEINPDDDDNKIVETGHDLYINETLVANLLPGTGGGEVAPADLVWDWYATDVMLYVGDLVTFTADGSEKNIVEMEARADTAIVGAGEIITGTTVEVSQDGVYTVAFTQWQDQVENKRCYAYIGPVKGDVIAGDYYIVGGEGFGDWADCLSKYHIDPETGEIELVVTAGDEIKIAKALDSGNIDWDSALTVDNVTKGKGYVKASADGYGNIVFITGGTYTIKIVDGAIEITSDEVEEPELDWIVGDYYVVGKGDKFGSWLSCLSENHVGTKDGEIEITASAGDAIKLAKANYAGGPDWNDNSALGASAVSVGRGYISADGDGNIVFNEAGTYTIKLVGGEKVEIYSDLEEPEIQLPATKVTLKFNDATITLAFVLPTGWKPEATDPTIYIFAKGGDGIGASFPGAAIDGREITVDANLADCGIIFSFKQGSEDKQSFDADAAQFKDGSTYLVSVGNFADTGNNVWKFNLDIIEV